VMCGLKTASFLQRLYPSAKFVFLVRNPFHCLLSMKRRRWVNFGLTEFTPTLSHFAGHWRRLAQEFREADFGYLLRYEDLISNPDILQELQEYLEISRIPADFIANSRVDWQTKRTATLSRLEKWRIWWITREEMAAHGYARSIVG